MSSLGDEHRSRLAASRGKKMPSFRGKLLTAFFHPFLKKIKKLSVGIRGTGFEHFGFRTTAARSSVPLEPRSKP